MAAAGISMHVAPPLAAAIERLQCPVGDDVEALRQELQLVAVSLGRVEEVLRDADAMPTSADGPAHYDISDATTDGGGQRGGGGGGHGSGYGGDGTKPPTAAQAPRWAKQAEHGPWRRLGAAATSEAAVE